MRLLKSLLMVVPLLLAGGTAMAQKVVFKADAPSMTAVGKIFKVEYSLNAKPDNDSFVPPSFDGFDVLAGPTPAHMSNISISGSEMVKSEKYTFTYALVGNAEGRFDLPAAKITVDGKEYTSKPLPIEVVSEEDAAAAQPSGSGTGGGQAGTQQGGQQSQGLAADDILIRAIVDNTSVYKGQPVKVAFKLYTRVPIAGRESLKMPAFNGFWAQELNTDNYTFQRETYNSRIYETRVLFEYLLFPQQAGVLQIEQLDITLVAQIVVQSRRQSILDDFFGGGPDIQQISRKVSSSPVTIKVSDWPAGAPLGFNGAVGNFSMTSDFPTEGIKANSSVNYTIRITGTGNLPLIQAPRLEVPASFEQYNIKTTESLSIASSGISGYRQFEYPLIARAEGEYTIDPVNFTYFNPETSRYVTLSTKEYNLIVGPDSTGGRSANGGGLVHGVSKEDIKILGQDIRFIKIGAPGFMKPGGMFMGSPLYIILLLVITGLFVFALIYLQKRIKEMRNTELVRGKRANRVALQRLKAAEIYMKAGSQRNFYEEMLKALWGYMGDKLNIPVATLTKESIREELNKKGVHAEYVARYIDLISECEYAQYSPAGSGQMHEIYRNGVGAISKLESLIKR